MKKIIIYSDKISSGKSTRLLELFQNKKNVCGILQILRNGKRHFVSLPDNEIFPMEEPQNSSGKTINIGNYNFSADAFKQARAVLCECLKRKNVTVVFDEFGKLELNEKGFYPEISRAIEKARSRVAADFTILIVVRDYLLEDFLKKFELSDNEILLVDNESFGQKLQPN